MDFDCKTTICYDSEGSISLVFENRKQITKLIWRLIEKYFEKFGRVGVSLRIRPSYCRMFPKEKARCLSC